MASAALAASVEPLVLTWAPGWEETAATAATAAMARQARGLTPMVERAAIRLQPNLSNYFNLAVLERLSSNFKTCRDLLSEIIGKSQPYANLFVQRGLCSAGMNQHDSAIADMLKALKLEENNVEAIQQIGLSLIAKQQTESAKQYLIKASTIRLASGQIEEYKKLLAIIGSLEKR